MGITTIWFFGFVILVIFGYRLLPERYKNTWLLLASAVFIVTWSWGFLVVILLLSLFNFFFSHHLLDARIRKIVLGASIGINILSLLVFKYADFYVPELTSFLINIGVQPGANGIQILAPIGLSFIVVQLISYQVDVYKGRVLAQKGLILFLVYVLYFPKMLAGPIERVKPFIAQLESKHPWSVELVRRDLALILVGLIRKILFADTLNAMIPKDAFQHPSAYASPLLAIWLLAYAFAIYNDFAGYTNIVRGISGLIGIEITNNFNFPYFARSFPEFWNRWHISLSNWLRDYIFFPSARFLLIKFPNRNNFIHYVLPPLITMMVSGLWHGISWNMLFWGGLHGFYLILERIRSELGARVLPDQLPKWRQFISSLIVFSIVSLTWVPFHTNLASTFQYWQSLFSPGNWQVLEFKIYFSRFLHSYRYAPSLWLQPVFPFIQAFITLIPAIGLDLIQHKNELAFIKWPGWLQGVLIALLILAFSVLSLAGTNTPFIYQGF